MTLVINCFFDESGWSCRLTKATCNTYYVLHAHFFGRFNELACVGDIRIDLGFAGVISCEGATIFGRRLASYRE